MLLKRGYTQGPNPNDLMYFNRLLRRYAASSKHYGREAIKVHRKHIVYVRWLTLQWSLHGMKNGE